MRNPDTRAPLALTVMLAALAGGCAHVGCEGIPDAPAPVAGAPLCNGFLDEGQRCYTIVHADRMGSTTLVVAKGQRYQIQVPPNQKWFDAHRCSSPPSGEPGSSVMNALRRWRRDDADWFTLMAAVTHDQEGRRRIGHGQPVATEPVLEVEHTGVLALYPNDVPGFYWNNKGEIVACIERLAPRAAPLSAPTNAGTFCPANR